MIRFFTALMVITILAVSAIPARAQEPTEPAPTATPAYWQAVEVTSGNQVIIERRISYGEIAVSICVLILLAALIILVILFVPKVYLR